MEKNPFKVELPKEKVLTLEHAQALLLIAGVPLTDNLKETMEEIVAADKKEEDAKNVKEKGKKTSTEGTDGSG